MKAILKTCAAAMLALTAGALASPTIELKDGSRVVGDIQGIHNGVYTVVSPSMGTVHVEQSNIARIVYGGGSNAGSSSEPTSTRNDDTSRIVQQFQQSLAQDPAAMKSIMSLQSDPQIQAILNDPAIVKAIQEGDYMSVFNNPKIQALESNAQVKQLLQQQEH